MVASPSWTASISLHYINIWDPCSSSSLFKNCQLQWSSVVKAVDLKLNNEPECLAACLCKMGSTCIDLAKDIDFQGAFSHVRRCVR